MGLKPSGDRRFFPVGRHDFGRDYGRAETGLKWVVSAGGRKYLANVSGGQIKAGRSFDKVLHAQVDERQETLS
jgi:hypothetical protein